MVKFDAGVNAEFDFYTTSPSFTTPSPGSVSLALDGPVENIDQALGAQNPDFITSSRKH